MERGERRGSAAAVAAMALSACCRRKALLQHFGERRGRCDAAVELPCDFCLSPATVVGSHALLSVNEVKICGKV